MARAQGARALMALAFETTYGTPPASGFTRMPFASASLGAEQPLLNSELLGYGRDPLAPIKDAVTADGDVVVPLDAEGLGVLAEGGVRDTHDHGRGSSLHPRVPVRVLDAAQHVDRDRHARGAAVRDVLGLRARPDHLADAALGAVDRHRAAGGAGRDGSGPRRARERPTALELKRFGHFNGGDCAQRYRARQLWSLPRSPMPTTSTGSRPSGATAASTAPTRPSPR